MSDAEGGEEGGEQAQDDGSEGEEDYDYEAEEVLAGTVRREHKDPLACYDGDTRDEQRALEDLQAWLSQQAAEGPAAQ